MVKWSKGKSIRGAKWFGQEQVFSETRGKPAEWDTTKGTKLITPILFVQLLTLISKMVWTKNTDGRSSPPF